MKVSLLLLSALIACAWSLRARRDGRQLLVGYWGQNGAGPANGPANYEKPLAETCRTTKYDILAVSFVIAFWDLRQGGMPALNFAYHCETSVAPQYPFLLRCPEIEKGIKECQRRGKKVLMSVGGATGDGTLHSPTKAKELAHTFFDLFLGGAKEENGQSLRPFGTAVMDGIDLDIEGGRGDHYEHLIRELRSVMDADPKKEYLITGAPQCPYPDHYLGPGPGTGLGEAGELVDHLYVQFYNNYCHTGAGDWFHKSLKKWLDFAKNKPNGPLIFVGVPGATGGASGAHFYRPPSELKALYNKVRDLPGIGGIMIWDVSWDQNNVVSGRRYSEHAFALLKRTSTGTPQPPPPGPDTQTPAPPHVTTQAPTPPLPATTKPPTGPFACAGKPNGIYADPADCSMYYQCHGGAKYSFVCPNSLKFNTAIKACDWPENVTC